MEIQKIPFVKLTLLFLTLAGVIYVYSIYKVDIIHNPEAVKEIIPYLYTATALASVALISFILAIILHFKKASK